MHLRVAVAAVLAATLAHPAAQSAPLPDADRFFAEARKRLASNGLLQSRYMYRERVTEVRANPFGRIGTGPVETFEVYPVQGQELTYRRLVARDGKPLPPDELVAQDRRFLARYNEWRRRLAAEGQNEREARLRKIADERARDQKQAAEVMELFTFALQRREALDGMPAIVVSFRPKPGAQPHTREARVAASFAGHAWVHEHEHEVIRVEADAVTDATIGWGVLGRLYKGAKATLTRGRIGDAWLPLETRFDGTGRALLFRKATFNFRREYSDYRPFDQDYLMRLLAASSQSSK
jgi:hypothetical protein